MEKVSCRERQFERANWEGRSSQAKERGKKAVISTGRDIMAFQLNLLYFTGGKFGSYVFEVCVNEVNGLVW